MNPGSSPQNAALPNGRWNMRRKRFLGVVVVLLLASSLPAPTPTAAAVAGGFTVESYDGSVREFVVTSRVRPYTLANVVPDEEFAIEGCLVDLADIDWSMCFDLVVSDYEFFDNSVLGRRTHSIGRLSGSIEVGGWEHGRKSVNVRQGSFLSSDGETHLLGVATTISTGIGCKPCTDLSVIPFDIKIVLHPLG